MMITMLMVASMTVMMLTRVMMMITLRILNMTIMMTSLLAMTTLLGKETVTWVRGCKCTAEFEAWAFWAFGFPGSRHVMVSGFLF